MNKSILIGCPTCGLDPDPSRWLDSLMKIQNQIRAMGMTQAFLAPYRMSWAQANNQIWDTAIRFDFDYVLRMDDDIWGVPDNAVQMLTQDDKDVIGAAYPSRHFPHVWCALNQSSEPGPHPMNLIDIAKHDMLELKEIEETEGVHPVDMVGFGMTLIKVEPFKSATKPMFSEIEGVPDDTIFAQLCRLMGIQQYVHMDVRLNHREITALFKSCMKKG